MTGPGSLTPQMSGTGTTSTAFGAQGVAGPNGAAGNGGAGPGRSEDPRTRDSINVPAEFWPDANSAIRQQADGRWVATLRVTDPHTRKPVILESVPIAQGSDSSFQKLGVGSSAMVSVPDARMISLKDTSQMLMSLTDKNFRTQNTVVPESVFANNYRNANSAPPANGVRSCKIGKYDLAELTNNVFRQEGMTVYADPRNPRSAGMATDSTSDEVHMFNRMESRMTLSRDRLAVRAQKFDTGEATEMKQSIGTGGLPSENNPIQELYPRSNILLNVPLVVPNYLPAIADILFGIGLVYKIIKCGEVAADAIAGRD